MSAKKVVSKAFKEIEKIEKIFWKKDLKEKDYRSFKAIVYNLILILEEIEQIIYATNNKKLKNIILAGKFEIIKNYIRENVEGLNEEELGDFWEEFISKEMPEKIEELRRDLVVIQKEFDPKKKGIEIVYTNKYLKAKEKRGHKELIDKIESKIEEYFIAGNKPGGSNLAKRDTIKKIKELHAWIPEPLDDYRIVYHFYPGKNQIVFEDIIDHKALKNRS